MLVQLLGLVLAFALVVMLRRLWEQLPSQYVPRLPQQPLYKVDYLPVNRAGFDRLAANSTPDRAAFYKNR